MNKDSNDIIIAAGTAVGSVLTLARNIKKKVNCKAYVLCTDKKTSDIIRSSKFIDEVYLIEEKGRDNYINSIKEWYADKKFSTKPIFYFTTDTSCFYVNHDRDWFQERFELCLPSSEIINTYTQKGLAELGATKAGLSVPKTRVIEKKDDVDFVLENFSFPIILKPQATYLKSNITFKIKVIHDKNEFQKEALSLIKGESTLLCQEFIPGGDNSSYYYLFYRTKDGDIYDNIGRKTLQSTPEGGIMLKGLVEYNDDLAKICSDFLNKVDYKGIGGIEFKKYNNSFYFIEMSTRLEGFFKIAEISNSPLSYISYLDLSDNIIEIERIKNTKQIEGIIYMDFISTMINRLKYRKYSNFIINLFATLFNPKIKINVFAINDQKPFWRSLKNIITK